jgi:outer membrane protein
VRAISHKPEEFLISMKRVISRSLPLACLLVAGTGLSAFAQAGAAAPAASAAAATTKVAVINFQAAVAQTNEGQRNFSELQTKFEPKRTQLKAQNDEVESLKKQLQAAGDKLSDAERQSRLQAIDTKEKALQRSAEDAQNDFQSEMQQTYQQLAEKVYGTLQAYATENGFGVVLDASATQQQAPTVLWAGKGNDITAAVVQAYNVKSGIPAPANVPSAPAPSPSHSAAPHTPAPKE